MSTKPNDPRAIQLGYFNEICPCASCHMSGPRRHLCRAICPEHKKWLAHKKECKKYEDQLRLFCDERGFALFKSGGDIK